MTNKLCDLNKKGGTIGKNREHASIIYINKKCSHFFPSTTPHNSTIKKGNLTIGFLLFFLPIFLNKTI